MLNRINNKTYFILGYFVICLLQVIIALSSELFVDEAFYWLEGQYLDWSYSEVPGFIPWMLALTQWLFPHDPFWLRLPTLTMAALVPWLGIYIAQLAGVKKENTWTAGLLLISLPLLGITGTLAIADIWIIGLSLLAFIFWIHAFNKKQNSYFVTLGLVLAIGINIHIRFWLIVLITCLVIFWQHKNDKEIIYSLLKITLPMMLLGFIPVLIFNINNDFPLLAFQLKDRHPWEFQANHFSFFFIQIVITTPLLFFLSLKTVKQYDSSSIGKLRNILVVTAVIHWLTYALLGFFSDTLRLNLHWTLVSYVLLLIAASLDQKNNRLKSWALLTGLIAQIVALSTLIYWQNIQNPKSSFNAQITQNAIGWNKLSEHTEQLLKERGVVELLTDNFMTLSQLAYYSDSDIELKAIQHPLNTKHGREKQLEIMKLFQEKTTVPHMLLVEHSTLKLEQQLHFYQETCQQLNGIELIDSLDLFNGLKTFHYFQTGSGKCQLPPIVYHEKIAGQISGWIIEDKSQPLEININSSNEAINTAISDISSNKLFNSLDPNKYQLKQYSFMTKENDGTKPRQLMISFGGIKILSHRLN